MSPRIEEATMQTTKVATVEFQTPVGKSSLFRTSAMLCFGALVLSVVALVTLAYTTVQQSLPTVVPQRVTLDGAAGREALTVTMDAALHEPSGAWHGLRLVSGLCEVARSCGRSRCLVTRARLLLPGELDSGSLRASAEFLELSAGELARAVAVGGAGLRLLCTAEFEVNVFQSGVTLGHTKILEIPIADGLSQAQFHVESVSGIVQPPPSLDEKVTASGAYVLRATLPHTSELARMLRNIRLTVRADLGYVEMQEQALEGRVSVDADASVATESSSGAVSVSMPFNLTAHARLTSLAKYALLGAREAHAEHGDDGESQQELVEHEVSFAPTSDAGPLAVLLGGRHTLGWHLTRVDGRRLAASVPAGSTCLTMDGAELACLKTSADAAAGTSTLAVAAAGGSLTVTETTKAGLFKVDSLMSMPGETEGAAATEVAGTVEATWSDASQKLVLTAKPSSQECSVGVENTIATDSWTFEAGYACGATRPPFVKVSLATADKWLKKLKVEAGDANTGKVSATVEGTAASGSWTGTAAVIAGDGSNLLSGDVTYAKNADGEISSAGFSSSSASFASGVITADLQRSADNVITMSVALNTTEMVSLRWDDDSILVSQETDGNETGSWIEASWPLNATHNALGLEVSMGGSVTTVAVSASKGDVAFSSGADGQLLLKSEATAGLLVTETAGEGTPTSVVDVDFRVRQTESVVNVMAQLSGIGGLSVKSDASAADGLAVTASLLAGPTLAPMMQVLADLKHSGDLYLSGPMHLQTPAGDTIKTFANLKVSRGYVVPMGGQTQKAMCYEVDVPFDAGVVVSLKDACFFPDKSISLRGFDGLDLGGAGADTSAVIDTAPGRKLSSVGIFTAFSAAAVASWRGA